MKKYLLIWILTFLVVGFEYYALSSHPEISILNRLQHKGFIDKNLEISVTPGRIVSLWMGWIGLGLMTIMNLYSMRKRFSFMQNWGKLSDWLNFHIFCGLLGPTLIMFHSNLKVRGIVSISFWSMVISFTSGIIGRYFYVQMIKEKNFFESEAEKKEILLNKVLEIHKINTTEDEKKLFKTSALRFVGVPSVSDFSNPFLALSYAVMGDIRLLFKNPVRGKTWPMKTEYILADYALNKRKAIFLAPFQRLLGYWHAFHFPFAIFMYVVAAIHVAAALILGV